jgi:hypothetical protein
MRFSRWLFAFGVPRWYALTSRRGLRMRQRLAPARCTFHLCRIRGGTPVSGSVLTLRTLPSFSYFSIYYIVPR